jgi:hypothetical protein
MTPHELAARLLIDPGQCWLMVAPLARKHGWHEIFEPDSVRLREPAVRAITEHVDGVLAAVRATLPR